MKLYENKRFIYEIGPEGGELFADHSAQRRTGHQGQAMASWGPGRIICFFPNCNGVPLDGHSGDGWMEYRRSFDGGDTWDDARPLPYSKTLDDLQTGTTAMCEKAVGAPNGDIVAFMLLCELTDSNGAAWEPFGVPTVIRSHDGGDTWTAAKKLCDFRGRVYDAHVYDGRIYVLIQKGGSPSKSVGEYYMLVSSDNGESFSVLSQLPFYRSEDSYRFYGTFERREDGSIIAYTYLKGEDEYHQDYAVSRDGGVTWGENGTAYFAKRIRNMQLVRYKNAFFMFGRSGHYGEEAKSGHIIVYCSGDGVTWDDGTYLKLRTAGHGAYSNTLLVSDRRGERVLFQSSHAYDRNRTNSYHWWLTAKEK